MTDLPALDDLMAKFRERMLAETVTTEEVVQTGPGTPFAVIEDRIAEIRDAIVSQHDTIAQLTRQPEPLTGPQRLRRLFPGLRQARGAPPLR